MLLITLKFLIRPEGHREPRKDILCQGTAVYVRDFRKESLLILEWHAIPLTILLNEIIRIIRTDKTNENTEGKYIYDVHENCLVFKTPTPVHLRPKFDLTLDVEF